MSGNRTRLDAEALNRLVIGQQGVVSRRQLLEQGASDTLIARWLNSGRLHRVHRGVFAVGHTALAVEARLHAALLYAGPGAALSHTTAAWIWRLIDTEPSRIHLMVPGRRRSLPEVRAHHTRRLSTLHCRGFPVTSVARTLVDLAGILSFRELRRAVAEADYRGLLDPREAAAALRSGRRGSSALRRALEIHLPELAQTLSVLEERFVELCQTAGLPLPEINASVERMRVDALWRDRRVAVELDGGRAHEESPR